MGLEEAPANSPMVFDWQLRASKKEAKIWTSPVAHSAWQAIKGSTVLKADKLDILKLFLDDDRIGEYDDMFDSYKVF
jgi:hypothetical protein